MEVEKQTGTVKEFKHPFHPHPLVLVNIEEQQSSDQSQIDKTHQPSYKLPWAMLSSKDKGTLPDSKVCWGCTKVISGLSYTCETKGCKYRLHKECFDASHKITHPLHYHHSLFLQDIPATDSWYVCALCKKKRNMFSYQCKDCNFVLDITCAFLSLKPDQNIYELKDIDGRLHPFIFIDKHNRDEFDNVNCSWCHETLIESSYFSVGCKIAVHKECFPKICTELYHPSHRLHPLVLQFDESDCSCKICQKKDHQILFYRCSDCKFDIHRDCIRSIPEIKGNHEHPFTLFYKGSFICDACGTEGEVVSYICSRCNYQVHAKCISLHPKIKVSRHDHVLSHKFFLEGKKNLPKYYCHICFLEMKTEHGSYQCSEQDCEYFVHVNCATKDDSLYEVVKKDDHKSVGISTKGMDSASYSIIPKKEVTEATKIKHFSHENHILVLKDKLEQSDKCDGCMLSILSTEQFYSCSEPNCNFLLHKTCAELQKYKHHWFSRFIATLEAMDWCECCLCERYCSGLFYKGRTLHETIYLCLRCVRVPNIIEHPGHNHGILFFDHDYKKRCKACGIGSRYGAFRCRTCDFALDFACITLPSSIRHKSDDHLLQLTYGNPDENDVEKEQYCGFCEEEIDSEHWLYYCEICDNRIHSKCGIGKHLFKEKITWPYARHEHNLIFVQKVYGYRECFHCGLLCEDQALICPECPYFVHSKCEFIEPRPAKDMWKGFKQTYKKVIEEYASSTAKEGVN